MPADPVLLFAYGNLARGDDALAPLLLNRLQQAGVANVCGHPAKYLCDYQIQVEHVLDLQDCSRVVLIDAHANQSLPFRFYPLQVRQDTHYTTHGMSAETLLHTYRHTLRSDPPSSYMLAISGESFDLGQALSAHAQTNLDLAFDFCQTGFAGDDLADLDRLVTD